jgi:hypothetical protein
MMSSLLKRFEQLSTKEQLRIYRKIIRHLTYDELIDMANRFDIKNNMNHREFFYLILTEEQWLIIDRLYCRKVLEPCVIEV